MPLKRSLDQALTVYLAAVCGIALLALSAPRLVSALYAVSGQRVLAAQADSAAMTDQAFKDVAGSLTEAAAWTDDGELRRDLGLAQFKRAITDLDGSGRVRHREQLDAAIDSLKAGLALKPSDPLGWTWLAYAQTVRDGPSRHSAEALKASILTGSVHPKVMFLRIDLATRNWAFFEPDDRTLVLRQVRLAWRVSQSQMMNLATNPLRTSLIRTALADNQADLKDFEESLSRLGAARKR